MKAMLWSSSVVLALGLLFSGCSSASDVASHEPALTAKGDDPGYTEKDYVALLDKCKLESREECQDADPKGTDDFARRACSGCRSDGTAAVCCRDQVINGVRVQSCEYDVKCSCVKIWNPVFDVVVCDYVDEVV